MANPFDWEARDRWEDERRNRNSDDYSRDESSRERWGRSGGTGAATPTDSYGRGSYGRNDARGDQRTHDWEVGDRNYSSHNDRTQGYDTRNERSQGGNRQTGYGPDRFGQSGYGQTGYGQGGSTGRSRWQDNHGNRSAGRPDLFTSSDYGQGISAWGGRSGYPGGGAGYSGAGAYREDDPRGFMDRAVDEVRSWFGDDDAERRREQDHRGRGPGDYTRSDERIREDANDRLTEHPMVDARQISVAVSEGEVTLSGTVGSRIEKRRAEDCVEDISGVKHVQNNLRVNNAGSYGASAAAGLAGTTGVTGSDTTESSDAVREGGTIGWGGTGKSAAE